MKPIYPKNKEHFLKLVPYAKRILSLLEKNKIPNVIYGSFAHFYHTRDKNMKVNDIDIMIKNKDFPKVIKIIEKEKITFKYHPGWQTCVIKKGKLKVEVDSVSLGYKKIKEKTLFKKSGHDKVDFYGLKVSLLSLRDLEEMYPVAYNRSRDDKARILKKIKHFERFFGRKLKNI